VDLCVVEDGGVFPAGGAVVAAYADVGPLGGMRGGTRGGEVGGGSHGGDIGGTGGRGTGGVRGIGRGFVQHRGDVLELSVEDFLETYYPRRGS